MTIFRTSVTVLAVIHAAFVGLTSLVGAFADGGDVWQRLLLILLHPLGAAGVLLLVLRPPRATTVDPRPRGAPDGERDRRPGPCAADGCWQRAGRLGACASLRGGSGHRDSLRAGTAAHGPRNSQIRLRPRGAERQAPCGHGRASVARCCRAFGVLDLIFDRVFFQERDRWRVLRRAEAGVVSRVRA